MRTWQAGAGLVALAVAALPFTAHGQVELIPALGYYAPIGGWTQQQDSTGFPPLRRQLSAAVFGARLSIRLTPRIVLESTFGATPSQVAVSTASGTIDINGGVYFASARAMLKVRTFTDGPVYDEARWDVMLGAGAGIVHRAGTAWENTSGVTAPAAVLVAGVAVGAFHLTLEDFVSWAQFDGGRPSQTRARMHHDLVGSLGFTLRLGGR